jgi:hypothetical protein
MMKALKANVASRTFTERLNEIPPGNQYKALCDSGPKASEVEAWINAWQAIVDRAKEVGLPEAQLGRPQFAFITTVAKFDPIWASWQEIYLCNFLADGLELPSVEAIVQSFRNK